MESVSMERQIRMPVRRSQRSQLRQNALSWGPARSRSVCSPAATRWISSTNGVTMYTSMRQSTNLNGHGRKTITLRPNRMILNRVCISISGLRHSTRQRAKTVNRRMSPDSLISWRHLTIQKITGMEHTPSICRISRRRTVLSS